MTLSPREIAQKLAAHYRGDPTRWRQGAMGALHTTCCVYGGAWHICAVAGDVDAVYPFLDAFRKAAGITGLVSTFNDADGRTVIEIVDVLDRVQ